jgi:hypothetical protein
MRIRSCLLAALAVATVAGCTVKVEDKGRAPDLQEGDPGQLPKVDIDPAKVEFSTDTQKVITPDVKVTPVEAEEGDTADGDSAAAPARRR